MQCSRSIVFVTGLALSAAGCGGSDLAQEWQLDRLRILAVRATPAEPRPGDTVTFDRLLYVPPDTTLETLANLKPAFSDDGKITAGNSSQISDGAAAVLIMSAEKAAELGLKPRARFTNFALAGTDPVTMLKGPIPVTEKIMDKAEITLDDIDLFEINEAFASVVLAWQKETGVSLDKVNVNGGAIALGHPLGCSGAKLMTTLVNELERSGGRYGFQAMCEGGGLANATIIERIDS